MKFTEVKKKTKDELNDILRIWALMNLMQIWKS